MYKMTTTFNMDSRTPLERSAEGKAIIAFVGACDQLCRATKRNEIIDCYRRVDNFAYAIPGGFDAWSLGKEKVGELLAHIETKFGPAMDKVCAGLVENYHAVRAELIAKEFENPMYVTVLEGIKTFGEGVVESCTTKLTEIQKDIASYPIERLGDRMGDQLQNAMKYECMLQYGKNWLRTATYNLEDKPFTFAEFVAHLEEVTDRAVRELLNDTKTSYSTCQASNLYDVAKRNAKAFNAKGWRSLLEQVKELVAGKYQDWYLRSGMSADGWM